METSPENGLDPPVIQRRIDRGEVGLEDLGLAGGEGAIERRAGREGGQSRRRLRALATCRQSEEHGESCPS